MTAKKKKKQKKHLLFLCVFYCEHMVHDVYKAFTDTLHIVAFECKCIRQLHH